MFSEICKLLWSNVEDKNAVLNMLNNDVRNGKTLREALTYSDWGERCEEVFKIFQGLEINLEIFKVRN